MAHAAPPAPINGVDAKYKRATSYFLEWLLNDFPANAPREAIPASLSSVTLKKKQPKKRRGNEHVLVEGTFAQDLQLEVAYFLLELDELSEAVDSAFFDVKLQKKTLVEASVVAKVAIDCATSVIARLQLSRPEIRDVADLGDMLLDHLERQACELSHDRIITA